ncbi:MAG: methylenetetrahydrofolate--tRNA-(uracil(54)-C(5))-methyltransferase (FADH(2)-oxidizing) TrmFO [Bacillota bacterium]
MKEVVIAGAGLAGAEAAWQIVKRGIPVELWEMRPVKLTPAHKTGFFAELVCSNSLKSTSLDNASGLLKEELKHLDSLIMKVAEKSQVPAGGALAVDREGFAEGVTKALTAHSLVKVINSELKQIPDGRPLIIATGPLTDGAFKEAIVELTGEDYFYFFDAAAPIITKESIDLNKVFEASRYNKGEAAYLNCPMDEQEYQQFYQELINAEVFPRKDFERGKFFEACVPIEELALRGQKTLTFGPLKPVGLIDPRTGKLPYAVIQLRQDDKRGNLYNMVGFQTNLTWPEQKKVFSLIPGLERADFVRYGVMHRNSFINAPRLLTQSNQLKKEKGVFFAGQLTGVEGYLESTASGLVAGLNAVNLVRDKKLLSFPQETAIGALHYYLVNTMATDFQPMNINFGLFPPLSKKLKSKKERNLHISRRALETLDSFIRINNI